MTVVTTAFNAEPFIGQAIRSVLAQCGGVAFEHVIVDDGSSDRTVDVVRAVGDERVRLLQPGRVGRGAALNLGVAAGHGPFVAILDADDVAHPDRLASEVAILNATPDAVLVGSGQRLFCDAALEEWPATEGASAKPVNRVLPIFNPLSHSSILVRRAAFHQVNGYDQSRRSLFDWDLYVRLAARGGTLLKLSVPLVAKRIHANQFFEGRRTFAYAKDCLALQWQALERLGRTRWLAAAFPALMAYRLLPRPARMAARRAVASS